MKSKIVILDAYTTSPLAVGETDPRHPDWEEISKIGDLTVYPRTRPEEVLDRAAGAPILLTNKVVLSANLIEQLPDLRYIGLMSTGTNAVDLEAARSHGITVCNVPAYSTASVAQHAIALVLELATRLSDHARLSRSGQWSNQPDFSLTAGSITELAGKNFGMVGCGEIARATAAIAHAMGMDILVHSRTERETAFPAAWLDRDAILSQSDVLSLHCPLTPETRHWINRETLARMRPSALLINTGRGPLVDETAVAEALENGRLGGYGADVTETEPPPANNPVLTAPRSVITPHTAWASLEARNRLVKTLAANLQGFLNGQPINEV